MAWYNLTDTPRVITLGGLNIDESYSPTTAKWKSEDGKPHLNPELKDLFAKGKRYATLHHIYPSTVYKNEKGPYRWSGDEVTLDFLQKLIDNDEIESNEIELEEILDPDKYDSREKDPYRELHKNREFDEPLSDELLKKYTDTLKQTEQRTKGSYWGGEQMADLKNIMSGFKEGPDNRFGE